MLRTVPDCFIVADKYQNRGLGSRLLEYIINIARREWIGHLEGAMLAENFNMKAIFVRAGFRFGLPEEGAVSAVLQLR